MSRWHEYPLEDAVGARSRASRLSRLEAAACAMLEGFVESRSACLALSYGKDSMVVLHLLHESGLLPKMAAVMWNRSGMEPRETMEFSAYVQQEYALGSVCAYDETHPDDDTLKRTLSLIDPSAKHPTAEFVYEVLEQPRWRVMDRFGIDGTIMGLRQDESRARRMNIACRGTRYWNKREKSEVCLPIARWSTRDVFEYVASRKVPLHPIYHRLPALGFDRDRVRLSSPVDIGMRNHGQLVALRRLYPETWAAYARLVPSIRDYA